MTDLTMLAAATVTAVAPYLEEAAKNAAGKAGEAAFAQISRLWQAVKDKLTAAGDGKAVERVEKAPTDADKLAALRAALAEAVENDPAFAEHLRSLLPADDDAAAAAGPSLTINGDNNKAAQVSGQHNTVNIG